MLDELKISCFFAEEKSAIQKNSGLKELIGDYTAHPATNIVVIPRSR